MKNIKCPVCNSNSYLIYSSNNGKIFRCFTCKVGFLWPIPSKKFISNFYTKKYFMSNTSDVGYKNYEKLTKSLEKESLRKIRYINRFVSGEFTILDVGSGLGDFALLSKEFGYYTEVLDRSSWVVKEAKKFGLKGYISDLSSSTLPRKRFNILTAWDVVEHFSDPLGGFKALNKLLKRNGLFFLTTPNLDSYDRKILSKYWYGFKKIPEHIFYYSPNSLRYIANKTSFELIEFKTWGFIRDINFISERLNIYNKFVGTTFKRIADILSISEKQFYFPLVDMMAVLRKK